MYTTIIHPIRKALNLSIREYVILDMIFHLSNNEKYGGWCIMSKKKMADITDLSESTIKRILNTLEDKDLIKRDKKTNYIKTKDNFNELIANKHDWMIGFKGKELALLSGKFNLSGQNDPGGVKMTHLPGQNDPLDRVKMTHNIYKYNNNNNNSSCRKNFDLLKRWLSTIEEVANPDGLAKKYYTLFSDRIIGKALKSDTCTNKTKFVELCNFYKSAELDKKKK